MLAEPGYRMLVSGGVAGRRVGAPRASSVAVRRRPIAEEKTDSVVRGLTTAAVVRASAMAREAPCHAVGGGTEDHRPLIAPGGQVGYLFGVAGVDRRGRLDIGADVEDRCGEGGGQLACPVLRGMQSDLGRWERRPGESGEPEGSFVAAVQVAEGVSGMAGEGQHAGFDVGVAGGVGVVAVEHDLAVVVRCGGAVDDLVAHDRGQSVAADEHVGGDDPVGGQVQSWTVGTLLDCGGGCVRAQ